MTGYCLSSVCPSDNVLKLHTKRTKKKKKNPQRGKREEKKRGRKREEERGKETKTPSLTGMELLISAGKYLPLIFIRLHSNTLDKGTAREVKN